MHQRLRLTSVRIAACGFALLILAGFVLALVSSPTAVKAQGGDARVPPFPSTSAIYMLYAASGNNRPLNQILQITKQGEVTTWLTSAEITPTTGAAFATFDDHAPGFGPDGTLYFADNIGDSLLVKPRNGPLAKLTSTEAISSLVGITRSVMLGMPAVGLDGKIYVTERTSDNILRIDATTGEPEIFVTHAALAAVITSEVVTGTVGILPVLVFDPQGALYVSNVSTSQVLKVDAGGVPSIFVSSGEINGPRWLAFAPDGTLYVEGSIDDTIYAVTPAGVVSPYLTPEQLAAPLQATNITLGQSMTVDSQGNLYILFGGSADSLVRFDTNGTGTVLVSRADFEAATGIPPSGNIGMAFAPGYPLWMPSLDKVQQ